ncbi:adenine phosphoribosyltransferase, partial [Parapusillimonas sp. SGNA-6]|nr:adenine phosphoribosyltransferase [Parapusillimonas sp. SGNA-6]
MLSKKLRLAIRDVPDFPRPGIIFKDITPILKDQVLCRDVIEEFVTRLENIHIDVVAGIESRGFLFGMLLAARLSVPFVPIRKQGKLPYATLSETYQLEYGEATIEIHTDAF